MADNFALLLTKINEFKQKYYLHKLVRGIIYACAVMLALYLFLFVSIYYTHPTVTIKTFLFAGFVLIGAISLFIWIIRPIMGLLQVGKTISAEEAAHFIGNHFSNVKDKLLNTLQLHSLATLTPENNALILAGIDQKIIELKPVPFARAINLGENKKHLKYFLLPFLIIVAFGLLAPSILKEGSYSFIRFNQEVLPKAPFKFVLSNKSLTVVQGDDLELDLEIIGDQVPENVYLEDGKNSYKLDKKDLTHFKYSLKNIQSNQVIRFSGGGFWSPGFEISVKPRPSVISFNVEVSYPSYLGKSSENFSNVGDLILPEGSVATWTLKSENSNELTFILGSAKRRLPVDGNRSSFHARILNNSSYTIIANNPFVSNKDSISHHILVIKDQFPSISVQQANDSLSTKVMYFNGSASDDYGINSIHFCVNVLENGKKTREIRQMIPVKRNLQSAPFFYAWLLKDFALSPGQTAEYYFEVADNDAVNGSKITRSPVSILQVPSSQAISDKINSNGEVLKQKMEEAIKLAGAVEKESKKLGEILLDKKQLTFEDKKQIEALLSKQAKLDEIVKEIREQNEKNNFEKSENVALQKEIADKQAQIDKLFENVLNDKTRELLQQLQKLMQENSKDRAQEQLSKMQMDNKSVKNELDRILELYKQLEFEQSLQISIDRLNQLAKEQQDLSNKTKANPSKTDLYKEQQKALSKEFEELSKELKKIEEKDKMLERPNGFESPKSSMNKVSNLQKSAENALENEDSKKAAESQQSAAQEMEDMAEEIASEQQEGQNETNAVNSAELRKLLEKLLSTSFEQEKTMLSLRKLAPSDPLYISNVQKQRAIIDNISIIGDSLFAISKRVPQISSTVNFEMQKINLNLNKSLESLGERKTAEANMFQQYTMTSVNNLALMLNEALEQLQKNQKSGTKGMRQLQQMQNELNKRMQQARDEIQKNGNKGSAEKGKMTEEFVRMAQQQQLIREALQRINREENKNGKGKLGDLNQVVQNMKRTESDLVNKRIEEQTLSRQRDILKNLLDAENAQQEQDEDSRRQAKAASEYPPSYQKMLEKFKKVEMLQTETLQKLPLNLQHYYQQKISEYYKRLSSSGVIK